MGLLDGAGKRTDQAIDKMKVKNKIKAAEAEKKAKKDMNKS